MIDETLGSYRIISMIGEGGMGVVYRAEHTLLGRKAAVKVLRSQIEGDLVDRFFNEARAAATLHHPSCVDVFDFGHRPDGSAYIIMELLEGEPLSERLDRETRLPIPLAAAIGRQVASALHVAHQNGIIHRDLKPGNIYLVADSEAPGGVRAKVLDFGIAKLSRDPVPRSVKTNSGMVFGTPRYMSPEQCRNARDVDGRADVYSLGCIFYEMLLGVAPFDYDSWAELVGAHLHETPPKPTELDNKLPIDVEMILLTALQKRPEDRFQTMNELAQAIEGLWRIHGNPRTPFTPAMGVRKVSVGTDDTIPPPSSSSTRLPPPRSSAAVEGADTMPPPPSGSMPRIARDPDGDLARAAVHRRFSPIAWIAGGPVLLFCAGVLIWSFTRRDPESKLTKEPRGYVVVDNRETIAEPQPTPALPDAAIEAAPAPAPPEAAAVARKPDRPARDPRETDTAQLTRTFGRRQPAVQACFRDHPTQISDAISIRVKIGTDGRAVSAEVLPANLAATPLANCLAEVARGTEFGPQPKPATFRIPIHTTAGK